LVIERQRLLGGVFRRSIAWLSDSLFTASQCGLPRPHAKLASGRWSGATGRAFHPQDSAERFQSCFLTSHPPFPSFLPQSHRPALCSSKHRPRRRHRDPRPFSVERARPETNCDSPIRIPNRCNLAGVSFFFADGQCQVESGEQRSAEFRTGVGAPVVDSESPTCILHFQVGPAT